MKKNVLFICCDMRSGGVQKSLATLLNCLNYDEYSVDLFLFKQSGLFMDLIPKEVNLLPENERLRDFIRRGEVMKPLKAYFSAKRYGKSENLDIKWLAYWKTNRELYRINPKKYDVAIAYNDGVELYYLVDCVQSKKKIAYNHIDYLNRLTYKPKLDRRYYEFVDGIITVSDTCKAQLIKVFPEYEEKIKVIENIIQKDYLIQKAGSVLPSEYKNMEDKEFKIVTVAGLFIRKGYDLAAEALGMLRNEGYNFRWFIIGIGDDKEIISKKVNECKIASSTVFLQEKANPYPYVKWADLFMLTSRAEGKCIAVEEAKLLECPILITNYSSAKDQINDGMTGVIAEMSSEAIAEKLRILMDDNKLRKCISQNMKNNCKSNEKEIMKKVYRSWSEDN